MLRCADREEISVGTNPFNIIYNSKNSKVYVVYNPSNTVSQITRLLTAILSIYIHMQDEGLKS